MNTTGSLSSRRAMKAQHVKARTVEPLRVVRDQQQWARVRRVGNKPVGGKGDAERIRLDQVVDAECCVERLSLGIRKPLDVAANRPEQLVQSRKGELGLRLDAHGRERASTQGARAAARAVQQRRLSDPGLPADHQRSAAVADAVQKRVDPRNLVVAPDQLAGRMPAGSRRPYAEDKRKQSHDSSEAAPVRPTLPPWQRAMRPTP